MSVLSKRPHPTLEWTQPSALRMEYELRDGSELLATLRVRSSFGTFAEATCGEAAWTFKRVGFWQQRASVRAAGATDDLGVFVNATWTGGGELQLADGTVSRATSNLWMTKFEWHDASDRVLLTLGHGGILRMHADVALAPDAARSAPLDLLAVFGCYLVVMLRSDSGGGAAAAAAG